MAYVVTEPCIGTKDHACVDVCPVDCFYEAADHLLIHPEECIDCGACVPVCPVNAIYEGDAVPEEMARFTENAIRAFAADATLERAPQRADWEAEKNRLGSASNRYYQQYQKA
jgi:NAD-dependent dihydropyrimidine dehydrogenase PreA subunit